LKLGGERRELPSSFFSDIQGFTRISEKLNPEKLTALLHEYLSLCLTLFTKRAVQLTNTKGTPLLPSGTPP
jgi:adenylate cyclase